MKVLGIDPSLSATGIAYGSGDHQTTVTGDGDRPTGLCGCGCGGKTTMYRGVPKRFVQGHNTRGRPSTRRVQKVVLACEVCGSPFDAYPSEVNRAQNNGVNGPRFCSAQCFESTRTGPKCIKCGGNNHRGRRYRVCAECVPASPAALAAQRSRERLAECPPGLRWCGRCDEFLAPDQFPSSAKAGHVCTSCKAKHAAAAHMMRNFGIDHDQYATLLTSQDGRCAICRKPPKNIRLHIDHDHKTGLIRGLLCGWCNHRLLSGARDSVDVLRSAADYLESPPAIGVLGERSVPKKRRRKR